MRFCGTLDTKTLGGAGFASQTTTADDKVWDLSAYDGIEIDVVEGDGKMYTLILKDEVPEGKKRDDGREKAGISWEYDFKASEVAKEKGEQQKFRIPWDQFKATYRGREKKDAEPLKTDGIRRFSLMMRRLVCILMPKGIKVCLSLIRLSQLLWNTRRRLQSRIEFYLCSQERQIF